MTIKTQKLAIRLAPILDYGHDYMLSHDGNLPEDFEKRMKDAMPKTSNELKPVFIELAKHPKYIYAAVRFMESAPVFGTGCSNTIALEFKRHLARIYGVKSLNYATIMEDRKAFWSHWPNEMERGR